MTHRLILFLGLACLMAPTFAVAQDPPTIIAQYFTCDQAREDVADQIFRDVFASVYDSHVEAGDITAWSWNQHLLGGAWRRLLFFRAPTRDAALEAWGKINEETDDLANNRFLDICPSHDDYIWSSVASQTAADAGENRVNVATYLVCDISREDRADEIVTEVFAPVWEEHVRAGDIAGWYWNVHDMGGRFRRLLGFIGADAASVMNGRDVIFNALQSGHADALEEFTSICSEHVDYVWNNLLPESDG